MSSEKAINNPSSATSSSSSARASTEVSDEKKREGGVSSASSAFFNSLRQKDRVIINIWSSEDNKSVPGANVGHVAMQTPDRYISLWPGSRDLRRNTGKSRFISLLHESWGRYFTVRPSNWKPSYLEDCISEALSEGHCREITTVSDKRDGEEILALLPDSAPRILLPTEVPPADAKLVAVIPLHATVRLALYGLHIGNIHTAFEGLRAKCSGWCLAGSNCLARLSSDHNAENCASVVYRVLSAGGMYQGTLKVTGSSDTSSVATPDKLIRHVMKAKAKEREAYSATKAWTFEGESNLETLEIAYGDRSASVAAEYSKAEKGSEHSFSKFMKG